MSFVFCCAVKTWKKISQIISSHDTGTILSREYKIKPQTPEGILQDLYWQGLGRRLLQSFAMWCLWCDAENASGYSLWCQEGILMEWWLSSTAADSRWISSPALGIEHLSFWCNFNPQIFAGFRSYPPMCPCLRPSCVVTHSFSHSVCFLCDFLSAPHLMASNC